MKSYLRLGSLVIAFGLVGLMAGCVSQSSRSSQRVRSSNDFEIVETSTKRTLSSREMAHLRAKVADYLDQQGVTASGDYYVKIFLGEEQGAGEGEWVVVRYTRYASTRFSLLASYPNYYDSYQSTYAYDYYPFPDYGFSRLSFQYYDYPYYGYHYYPTPISRRPRGHHGDRHDDDRRPDRDRDDDRDRPNAGSRPSGALKPSFVPSGNTANTRTRWAGTPPVINATPREHTLSRRNDARLHWRNRETNPGGTTSATTVANGSVGSSYTAPRTVTAPSGNNSGALRPPRRGSVADAPQGTAPRYNRTERNDVGATPRPVSARERSYTPPSEGSGRSHYSSRSDLHSRSERARDSSPPPAVRSEPAPARSAPAPVHTAPVTRSETTAESKLSDRQEVSDGGNRGREP